MFILWRDEEPEVFTLQREEAQEVGRFDFDSLFGLVEENTIPHCIMLEELKMIRIELENLYN